MIKLSSLSGSSSNMKTIQEQRSSIRFDLRISDPWAGSRPGRAISRYGDLITDDSLKLIKLEFGTFPEYPRAHVLDNRFHGSSRVCERAPDYTGKVLTVESVVRLNNKDMRRVEFIGMYAGKQFIHTIARGDDTEQFQGAQDSVSHIFSTGDLLLTRPLKFYYMPPTVGSFMSFINILDDIYNTEPSSRYWPEDQQGDRILTLDMDCFTNYRWTKVKLEGQRLKTALDQVYAGEKDTVLRVAFHKTGGTIVPKKIDLEQEGIDIVIGATDAVQGTCPRYLAECNYYSGDENDSTVINRIIGLGDNTMTYTATVLAPVWTEAQQNAVIANPSLANTPEYQYVGHAFTLIDSSMLDNSHTNARGNDMLVMVKRESESDSAYRPFNAEYVIRPEASLMAPARNQRIHGKRAAYGYNPVIWFKDMMWTSTTEDSEAPYTETKEFYTVKLQHTTLGVPLTVDSGKYGEAPYERAAYLYNLSYQKTIYDTSYRASAAGLIEFNSLDIVDPSPLMLQDAQYLVQYLSRPSTVVKLKFPYPVLSIVEGDVFNRIVDTNGKVLYSNLGWIILHKVIENYTKATWFTVSSQVQNIVQVGSLVI